MKQIDYHNITEKITELLSRKSQIIVAIDGYAASGKTTLSDQLKRDFSCNVIHMDDFYLPLELRDADWKTSPGKNIDFLKLGQVLEQVKSGKAYSFCPYSCALCAYKEPVVYSKKSLTIVEGSYSCFPGLNLYYDFSIFLEISSSEQKKRILTRNGEEGLLRFQKLWIPLEHQYFREYHIRESSDFVFLR